MLSVSEAQALINNNLPAPRLEQAPLSSAVGRVIAENVFADIDLPPFDKSAMDGYAVRAEDLKTAPVELELIETVLAGEVPKKIIRPGKTIKIMTGAKIPPGADAVVKREDTEEGPTTIRFLKPVSPGGNICYLGEDLKKGDKIISAGSVLNAPDIGVLAMVGKYLLKVYSSPTTAIFSTGDELVDIKVKPRNSQIRNSNAYLLSSRLNQWGIPARQLGIARDTAEELTARIRPGLKADILVITGGVSAGDTDLVEPVLKKLGVKIIFNAVAIKPGKPFVFGRKQNHLVFALPGNPASAFVIMEVFIRPALASLTMNPTLLSPLRQARLTVPLTKASERQQYVPAKYNESEGTIEPVRWHGSADLVAITQANALIIIPPETIYQEDDLVSFIET